MTTITPELLAEIRAGCESTTQGPWRVVGKSTGYINGVDPYGKNREVNIGVVGDYRDKECLPHCRDRWDADAAHIARMDPPTTLALVAALDMMRADWPEKADRAIGMEPHINLCDVVLIWDRDKRV